MAKSKRSFTITDILLIAVFWLLLIVISPIIIPLLVYAFAKNKYEAGRLRRFLRRNEGARFFCYTNKETGLSYIREKILPHFDLEVQIIYMSQKGRLNLGDNSRINTLIASEAGGAKRGGYPCIAKVVKGKLVCESLNTELYRTVVRKGEPDNLIHRINDFFDSSGAT